MVEIPRDAIQKLTSLKLGAKLNPVLEIIGELLSPREKNRGTCLDETWSPSQKDIAYGEQLGLTEKQILEIAENMRLWAGANRNRAVAKKANWSLTFMGFMRREAGKQGGKYRAQPQSVSYMDLEEEIRAGMNGNGQGHRFRDDIFPDADIQPRRR